jgi:hypothetical protein
VPPPVAIAAAPPLAPAVQMVAPTWDVPPAQAAVCVQMVVPMWDVPPAPAAVCVQMVVPTWDAPAVHVAVLPNQCLLGRCKLHYRFQCRAIAGPRQGPRLAPPLPHAKQWAPVVLATGVRSPEVGAPAVGVVASTGQSSKAPMGHASVAVLAEVHVAATCLVADSMSLSVPVAAASVSAASVATAASVSVVPVAAMLVAVAPVAAASAVLVAAASAAAVLVLAPTIVAAESAPARCSGSTNRVEPMRCSLRLQCLGAPDHRRPPPPPPLHLRKVAVAVPTLRMCGWRDASKPPCSNVSWTSRDLRCCPCCTLYRTTTRRRTRFCA